jgi:DNA-binding response OmpR family regulator
MIVDDDDVTLAALGQLIAQWGHDVLMFPRFESARTSLTTDGPPDVLVVDVRLGMFNGLQLVHVAKQLSPAMTIVAVSGFDDPVLRAEAAAAGAAFLPKPLDLAELRYQVSATPSAT